MLCVFAKLYLKSYSVFQGDPRDRKNIRTTYRKVEKILLLTQMASHLTIQRDTANIFS